MTEKQYVEEGVEVVTESSRGETAEPPHEVDPGGDDEFKLTIRKLEVPVRPRGVLAE